MNQVARLSLIDRADPDLSLVAQCRLLKVSRSSLYWRPVAASEDDLRLMRRIDELYLGQPHLRLGIDRFVSESPHFRRARREAMPLRRG